MTPYELARRVLDPFLPMLHGKVRRELSRLVKRTGRRPLVLDVGGRTSPYTVGIPASITVLDLPRESEIQHSLHLGLTTDIQSRLRRRRTNVEAVVLEDMTRTTLESNRFDGVVCVEVIEHVPDDESFVRQVARVLKPGGWFYLTTPNGDYVRNQPPHYNPDHLRHYERQQLLNLLCPHFENLTVKYGVRTGRYRTMGIGANGMSLTNPLALGRMAIGNVVNRLESRGVDDQPRRTAHLFAVAWKPVA